MIRRWLTGFPFPDAPDTAAITCCHVLDGSAPILHAAHDEDDGMWQFLCGRCHSMSEARVASLRSIYTLDRSISPLAKMPCGCVADRQDARSGWHIQRR